MAADHTTRVAAQARRHPAEGVSAPSRARIIEAATALFAAKGFQATTVRDLAAHAGVNVAAVNYHFRSKDDLHVLVVDTALSRWSAEILVIEDLHRGHSLKMVLRGIIEALISPVFERPDSGVVIRLLAWSLLERGGPVGNGRIGAFAVVLAQLLDPHLPENLSLGDSVLLAEWLVGQCLLIGLPHQAHSRPDEVAAIVDRVVDLAMHGFAGALSAAP